MAAFLSDFYMFAHDVVQEDVISTIGYYTQLFVNHINDDNIRAQVQQLTHEYCTFIPQVIVAIVNDQPLPQSNTLYRHIDLSYQVNYLLHTYDGDDICYQVNQPLTIRGNQGLTSSTIILRDVRKGIYLLGIVIRPFVSVESVMIRPYDYLSSSGTVRYFYHDVLITQKSTVIIPLLLLIVQENEEEICIALEQSYHLNIDGSHLFSLAELGSW